MRQFERLDERNNAEGQDEEYRKNNEGYHLRELFWLSVNDEYQAYGLVYIAFVAEIKASELYGHPEEEHKDHYDLEDVHLHDPYFVDLSSKN